MILNARASAVKAGYMIESIREPGSFVPCRKVARSKAGYVLFYTFEGIVSLRPEHKIKVWSASRRAVYQSGIAKTIKELVESSTEATVMDERVSESKIADIVDTILNEIKAIVSSMLRYEDTAYAVRALSGVSKKFKISEDAEDLEVASLYFDRWLMKFGHLLEYRMLTVTDPNNRWAKSLKRPSTTSDGANVAVGTKRIKRASCDGCGAPLRRIGPARKSGWGLYVCDYCGSEYSIKEF